MKKIVVGVVGVVAALAGAAAAQTRVSYEVLGSVSPAMTGRPWPNVQAQVFEFSPSIVFDDAGASGVMLGDDRNSWVFTGPSAAPFRVFQQPVPGVAGLTWQIVSFGTPYEVVANPSGGFSMNWAPVNVRTANLRASQAGLARAESVAAFSEDGESAIVTTASTGMGVERGGVAQEIVSGAIAPMPWKPEWTTSGMPNIPLGFDPRGRIVGVTRRFMPFPQAMFAFAADPETRRVEVLAIDGGPAGNLGVINFIERANPDVCGIAADGTFILEASVRYPSGDGAFGQWAVGIDGSWRPVFLWNTPVNGLPSGVVFADSTLDATTMNASGKVAAILKLGGATTANDTVIASWDRVSGVRIVAREGDPVPGSASGAVYGEFNTVYIADRGDIAFRDPAAIYLDHPSVGTAEVARLGAAVAGGRATGEHASQLVISDFGTLPPRTRTSYIRGRSTYLRQDGTLTFAAKAGVHAVAYSARLDIPCPADFNGDGFTDFFDYSDYVACFEDGVCPGGRDADFNADGFVDFFDYGDYVAAFEAGC